MASAWTPIVPYRFGLEGADSLGGNFVRWCSSTPSWCGTDPRVFRDFVEPAGFHVVEIAVDRDVAGDQRMVAKPANVSHDAPPLLLDREPVDKIPFRRARPLPTVVPAAGIHF